MSSEDALARAEVIRFADGNVPMGLEALSSDPPPLPENPQVPYCADCDYDMHRCPGCGVPLEHGWLACLDCGEKAVTGEFPVPAEHACEEHKRYTGKSKPRNDCTRCNAAWETVVQSREAEKAAKKAAVQAAREAGKLQRAQERAQLKIDAVREKITLAEGGLVQLPAAVTRDGTVRHVDSKTAWFALSLYLDDMAIDVETSGYPLGHKLHELRTVQLGGEECAIVFDAADPEQMKLASLALTMAKKLRAHSATADVIPCVEAGLIGWEDAWGKMQDSVLNAKLTDPKMSGSDADALKQLANDLLREYAVSPQAETAKNALFTAMGCIAKPAVTTPPEKNGWYSVNKNSVVMTRYAGSDVLDLAAVLRVLPPIPVDESVMLREREFQTACASITHVGFQLDVDHTKKMITEYEAKRDESQHNALILSDGRITNPKSPDVIKILPEIFSGLVMPVNRKTKRPSADKDALAKVARTDNPTLKFLCQQIAEYRHCDTTLGLLLRQLEALCDHGDGRMRPTVYTIEATTGRSSCRRPNSQQFSRQGGIRACVVAGEMNLELVNGQWEATA